MVVAYTNKLYKPLKDIAKQASRAARALARLERIAEILSSDMVLAEGTDGYDARTTARRARSTSTTCTSGTPQQRAALEGVTLHVPSGSRLALVGESGAGKSTVGALVARFYDPSAGSVRVDGRDAREWSLRWVRDQVGVLLQDTILFSGSVRDNIAYGTDADLEQIEEVARAAGALSFILALPEGFDTLLGPGGVGLSGGQRQRIGIARVLLRDPPVLVLDEPTTGLDAASETLVMAGLNRLIEGRTTILITHSTALARSADHVAVMAAGRVVEYDTPQRLLTRDSAFRRLTGTQATTQRRQLGPARVPGGAGTRRQEG